MQYIFVFIFGVNSSLYFMFIHMNNNNIVAHMIIST